MTPNFLKSNVGGGAGHTPSSITSPVQNNGGNSSNNNNTESNVSSSIDKMDGDHSGKALDAGASSAAKAQDMTEGVPETGKQGTGGGFGDKTTGHGTSMFSKDGAIGKMFTTEGAVGGTAQSIGGPLDQQGMVGKHFGADGSIGGTAQKLAEKNESH